MPPSTGYRADLREVLRKKSLLGGHFVLSSGTKSPVYIDCRTTTLDPRGAMLVARAFLSVVHAEKIKAHAIGGLALGAVPIVTAVAILSGIQNQTSIQAFVVRKEAKAHGTRKFIEGYDGKLGARVIIADDVCASGGSILTAAYRAEEAGYVVVAVICLVDREEGGGDIIRRKYPFYPIFTFNDLKDVS